MAYEENSTFFNFISAVWVICIFYSSEKELPDSDSSVSNYFSNCSNWVISTLVGELTLLRLCGMIQPIVITKTLTLRSLIKSEHSETYGS